MGGYAPEGYRNEATEARPAVAARGWAVAAKRLPSLIDAPFAAVKQMLQITPVMGYVAAHAQGMTIGPNILILPPLNPVHVAEEAATLDVSPGLIVR